jgi:hypothetical protein
VSQRGVLFVCQLQIIFKQGGNVRSVDLRPVVINAPDAPMATGIDAGVVLWRGLGRDGLGAGVWLGAVGLDEPASGLAPAPGLDELAAAAVSGLDEAVPGGIVDELARLFEPGVWDY